MRLSNGALYTKLPNTKTGFVLSNGWLYSYGTGETPGWHHKFIGVATPGKAIGVANENINKIIGVPR